MSKSRKSQARRNVELKAKYEDLEQARTLATALGARFLGVLHQRDTYFAVPKGRLKLRETEKEEAVLIWYDRPNRTDSRLSRYHLVPVQEPDWLKQTLKAALGLRTIVEKKRELYQYRNVRIHLDQVQGLGNFLEFEAVLEPQHRESHGHSLLADLRQLFEISEDDLLAQSYSELMLQ